MFVNFLFLLVRSYDFFLKQIRLQVSNSYSVFSIFFLLFMHLNVPLVVHGDRMTGCYYYCYCGKSLTSIPLSGFFALIFDIS